MRLYLVPVGKVNVLSPAASVLRLDDVSRHRIESREGLVERHALARKEPDPVDTMADGDLIFRGIDGKTCQRDFAVGTDLDLVHLTDVEVDTASPLSVCVTYGAIPGLDGGGTFCSQSVCNGNGELVKRDVQIG